MAAARDEIREWLLDARMRDASHVIIVCDTFDYEDYPVEVPQGADVQSVIKMYDGINMQRIMEVYDLSTDFEEQLNEHRAYHV